MTPDPQRLHRRNRRLGLGAAGLVAGMLGLSFAAVPLYTLFCQVTGYGGTPGRGVEAPGAAGGARSITVRFAATIQPGLPWRFEAVQPSMRLALGDEGLAFYAAASTAAQPVTGTALYNVTPEKVGRYFRKVQCFCFDEQTLAPGQSVEMPVSFWVDPAIATDPNTRDVTTITLSYTFFRSMADAERNGALASAGPHAGGPAAAR